MAERRCGSEANSTARCAPHPSQQGVPHPSGTHLQAFLIVHVGERLIKLRVERARESRGVEIVTCSHEQTAAAAGGSKRAARGPEACGGGSAIAPCNHFCAFAQPVLMTKSAGSAAAFRAMAAATAVWLCSPRLPQSPTTRNLSMGGNGRKQMGSGCEPVRSRSSCGRPSKMCHALHSSNRLLMPPEPPQH